MNTCKDIRRELRGVRLVQLGLLPVDENYVMLLLAIMSPGDLHVSYIIC
jgi:hypothetical protein